MLAGVEYLKIDDEGLHIRHQGEIKALNVDNIVICAGQLSLGSPYHDFTQVGQTTHLIGGAKLAVALDATRAIKEGYLLGCEI